MNDEDTVELQEAAEALRSDAKCNLDEAIQRFLIHAELIEEVGTDALWKALCKLHEQLNAEGCSR